MAEEKKPEAAPAAPAPKDAAAAAAPAAEVKPPRLILGFPLLVAVLLVLNLLVMTGGVGFLGWYKLVRKTPVLTETQAAKEIEAKVAPKTAVAVPHGDGKYLETYAERTINLRSMRGALSHYVTLEIVLECPTEECLRQAKNLRSKVEDTIQSAISRRSYTELSSLEAKFRLKHEMLSKINGFLRDTVATELYFTSFIIQ